MGAASFAESRWPQVQASALGGPYILDFTCAEAHLAVEVDGSQHYTADGLASDAARTAYLEAAGVRVLRFSNRDVLTNAAGVLEAILQALGA